MNGVRKRPKAAAVAVAPPRVPTPMPPPKENLVLPYYRSGSSVVGSDASYRLSAQEIEALNAVKAQAPRMDRNGYFSHIAATAKKKRISLVQPRPPRVAFAAPPTAPAAASAAPPAERDARAMTQRAAAAAPRARDHALLECYRPRYHHIRECDAAATRDYSARRRRPSVQPPQPSQPAQPRSV